MRRVAGVTGAVVVAGAVELALDRDGAVWRSVDAGARWERVLHRPRARDRSRVWETLDPPHAAEAGDEDTPWEPRTDLGALRGELEGAAPRLWCDPGGCWVVRIDGAFRSVDGGVHWVAQDLPPAQSIRWQRPRRGRPWLPALTIDAAYVDVADTSWVATPEWVPADGRRPGWSEIHLLLTFAPPRPQEHAVDVVVVGGRRFVVGRTFDVGFAYSVSRALAEAEVAREAQLTEWVSRRASAVVPADGPLLERVVATLHQEELDAQIRGRGEGG